jgi:iron complex transport system substrate-binding protein
METKKGSFGKPFLSKRFVVIAIALCSVLLVALPTIAAEDDFVLGVYGNANEDDTIDMRDLTYVKLIFFGEKQETELADAKYDGEINPLDFVQIKLVIVGKEKELTLVDSADRIVTVKKPIKRMVTATSNFVEAMRSLKQDKDTIVGVTEHVLEDEAFFPEFSDYASIGTWHFDIEKVLSLYPDVVLLYASYQKDEREKLEDAGTTVLCFDLYRPGDTYVEEMEKLGYLLDKEEEAKKFTEFYEGHLNTVEEQVKDIPKDERPRVYLESTKPYHTAGEGAGWHQKIVSAGGNNIFCDLSGYPDVDPEEVMARDPAIILKLKHGSPDPGGYDVDDPTGMMEMRNEIMNRTELATTTAVREGRVYALSDSIYSGSQCFVGVAYLAKWFHPELFEDLDPEAIHQEYLTDFQELDYDLDEHGVFAYPPIECGGDLAGIPDN